MSVVLRILSNYEQIISYSNGKQNIKTSLTELCRQIKTITRYGTSKAAIY
jgi:hypothetical protein